MNPRPLPDDVIEFLKQNEPLPLVDDEDLTAKRAGESVWNCDPSTARKRLDKLVTQGKMTVVRKRSNNGMPVNVYVRV